MENEFIRRKGRFFISKDIITGYPEEILLLMAKMIVVRAEYLFDRDAIEYIAISDLFDPVDPGVMAPDYEIVGSKIYNLTEKGEELDEIRFSAHVVEVGSLPDPVSLRRFTIE